MQKKVLVASILILSLVGSSGTSVFAKATPGDRVITLGADLSPSEKQAILSEFKQTAQDQMITVTAADEVKYLPGSTLAGKEYSSSLITIEGKGAGITVTRSDKITEVTSQMYQNALLTAGIQDAAVSVTAPRPVTGTAALTGIFKAFEVATGNALNEDRKKTAGQEIVQTSLLGKQLGNPQKASDFVERLKEEMQKSNPQTDADYQKMIHQVMTDMGIQLSTDQIQGLTDLLKKLKSLNVDWQGLGNQLLGVGQKVGQYAQDHPDKTNAILNFFKQLIKDLQNLLSKLFS